MPTHDPNLPPALVAMPTAAPARKVVAATAGAGVGGVLANLIVWALGAYVLKSGVPDSVSAFVFTAVPVVLSFVSGYVAKRAPGEVPAPVVPAPAPVADVPNAPVKKAAARKRPAAKKAAPKTPKGLS